MMNFLPQGYSFQSDSNPYQHQFISPYYGSGQYGWQYSPMAQTGPRLPTVQPGTAPPWLPPGLVATTSSGIQELSVLFDPTLASRMATAYNPWTIAYWGKPDIPAWLWPDGAAPQPVPPNVCCDFPPCVGPGGGPGGGGGGGVPGPGIEPPPNGGPVLTPGPDPVPVPTPKYIPPQPGTPKYIPPQNGRPTPTPGPQITPAPWPKSTQPNPGSPLRRGMFNSRWGRARAPVQPPLVFSTMPLPGQPSVIAANPDRVEVLRGPSLRARAPRRPRTPDCYTAPDKGACWKCCVEHSETSAGRQKCLNQCVGLPEPKPEGQPGPSLKRTAAMSRSRLNARRLSRIRSSARRRAVPALPIGVGPMRPLTSWRCYTGVCRGTDKDNLKTGDCVQGPKGHLLSCCCSTVIV